GRADEGDSGRHGVGREVLPGGAGACAVEGIGTSRRVSYAVGWHAATIGPSDVEDGTVGLGEGEGVVGAAATEAGRGDAVDEQIARVHAGHIFAEGDGDGGEGGDGSGGQWCLARDGGGAGVDECVGKG